MSDIERVPSIRKSAKQGVPKKPRRDMARPINDRVPKKPAEPKSADSELLAEPELLTEPELATDKQLVTEPMPKAEAIESVPSLSKFETAEVEPAPAPEPEPEPVVIEAAPVAADTAPETVPSARELAPLPLTVREMVRRVEESWAIFRASAARFPLERMDEHLTEGGWTRKQMLAHIGAWHDLAADRLWKFVLAGQPVFLDRDTDAINASVARQAIGKTTGEILKDMEMTYNRLHRQMSRLTDDQLAANSEWAAQIIGGNTFEHYDEHAADLYMPEPESATGRR